ncbi:MAG: SDR family oxidoreductase [Flavobacteriales bacterium]|nr:SDR family oxidoreductase [Flavobacteriales bacterium]
MRTALITGGSSGIGYAMSKRFARDGYRLLWVALDEQELIKSKAALQTEIDHAQVEFMAIDLSEPESAQSVYDWSAQHGWAVDVLVNNAGFGTYGYVSDIPVEREEAMIHTNVLATYRLTRLFLDDMLKRDAGTIIQIASNSAFQPVARMNTYAATKAFVHQFGRALQEELELKKSRVKCITVCPAAIKDTAFRTAGHMDDAKTFNGLAATTADEVADDVWRGFVRGSTFIVTGARMRFLHGIRRLVPYVLQQWMVRRETARANDN